MNVRIPAALAAALIALSPISAPAQSTPAAQIAALQLQAVNEFLAAAPEVATFLGDYSHDGDWSDPTPAGIAHFKAMLSSYEQKIGAIDMTGATLQDRNDIRLMRAFVVGQRRAIADQEAGKDPSAPPLTVLGAVFTMILHKDEQDPNVWWDHVISRMEKAPAWMAAQRPQITHPGTPAGAGGAQGARDGAGPLLLRAHADVGAAARRSAGALRQGARRARRVDDASGRNGCTTTRRAGRINYAMGADAYNAMLRDELLLPYNADQIAAIGQKTLDAAMAAERKIKAEAKAKGVNLSNPAQAAANGGGMTPTTKDAQFAFFQAQLDTLRAFIAKKRIVTIPLYVGADEDRRDAGVPVADPAGRVDESAADSLQSRSTASTSFRRPIRRWPRLRRTARSSKTSTATEC